MLQKIHLQYGLIHCHGLDGEFLRSHNGELDILRLRLGNSGGRIPLDRAFTEALFKPRLILTDLPFNGCAGVTHRILNFQKVLANAKK